MMVEDRRLHILQSLSLLLFLVPCMARAQLWSFDTFSVEALIDDHKTIRSRLAARSGIEQANQLLHDYAQAAAVRDEFHDLFKGSELRHWSFSFSLGGVSVF